MVAGPWGEISDDFHELLLELAEARVAKEARVRGWEAAGRGGGAKPGNGAGERLSECRGGEGSELVPPGSSGFPGTWGPGCCPTTSIGRAPGGEEEKRGCCLSALLIQQAHMSRGLSNGTIIWSQLLAPQVL